MSLSRDNRNECSITVNELQNTVNSYETTLTQISGQKRTIQDLEKEITQFEQQLSNSRENEQSEIHSKINHLNNQLSLQKLGLEQLEYQLETAKNHIDRLNQDYNQLRCYEFFHKPSTNRYI